MSLATITGYVPASWKTRSACESAAPLRRDETTWVELLRHHRDVVRKEFAVDVVAFAVVSKNRPTCGV